MLPVIYESIIELKLICVNSKKILVKLDKLYNVIHNKRNRKLKYVYCRSSKFSYTRNNKVGMFCTSKILSCKKKKEEFYRVRICLLLAKRL